jgi:glycosyltransferase involved in cell wall biosynthesis
VGQPFHIALMGLIAGGYSGVPRYAAALSRALGEVVDEFDGLQLSLVTTREGANNVGPTPLRVVRVPFGGRYANTGPGRIALEQCCARLVRADLLHFFDLTGPVLAPRRPFVTTVHDMSVLHGLRPRKHAYKRRLWPWAAARARRLIAISDFARDEAVAILGVESERVTVVHSGPGFTPQLGANGATADVAGRYALYVGALAASKNLPFLIEAFDRARTDLSLVLAGKPGDGYDELRHALANSRRPGAVVLLENVSDARLDALYRDAVALVHPSRYEGFGFTPLEAMARGCPVLASDIPALREVAGDGAQLLPLADADAWARALERAAADAPWRDELRRRGERRVARFSWQQAARSLCRVFLDASPQRS